MREIHKRVLDRLDYELGINLKLLGEKMVHQ